MSSGLMSGLASGNPICNIPVSTLPGQTALTETLPALSSSASAFVKPTTALERFFLPSTMSEAVGDPLMGCEGGTESGDPLASANVSDYTADSFRWLNKSSLGLAI